MIHTWKLAVNRVLNTLNDPDAAGLKYLSEYAGYITDGNERVYIADSGDAYREVERRNLAITSKTSG